MKKLVKFVMGVVVLGSGIIGVLAGVNKLANWLAIDKGREILGVGIGVYIIYRFLKAEFGE